MCVGVLGMGIVDEEEEEGVGHQSNLQFTNGERRRRRRGINASRNSFFCQPLLCTCTVCTVVFLGKRFKDLLGGNRGLTYVSTLSTFSRLKQKVFLLLLKGNTLRM